MRCRLTVGDQQQVCHLMDNRVFASSACDADLVVLDSVEFNDHWVCCSLSVNWGEEGVRGVA